MSVKYDVDAVRDETGRVLQGAEKHAAVLRRRLNHLHSRIQQSRREGRTLSYDTHEADALEWALSLVDGV